MPPLVTRCLRVFATTFLGHRGWLFRTGRACIAVDPLLCERFGAQHALDYQVSPPRRLDLARFPALDAVVLTHEHDDHFDIPSLARLSRKIPIHPSARSSSAPARRFEYVPSACAFHCVEVDHPESEHLLGLESWASDLLRVLRGDFGPIALSFGRAQLWNVAPDIVPDVIFDELSRVSHPLRRTAETLQAYERLWESVAATRARVAAKKRGRSAT